MSLVKEIEILAEHNKTKLLGYECDLSKSECVTNESIIIWEDDIHLQCPFELIKELNLVMINNSTYYSEDGLLFKIINEHHVCGTIIYETTSGLYLAFEDDYNNFEKPLGLRKAVTYIN